LESRYPAVAHKDSETLRRLLWIRDRDAVIRLPFEVVTGDKVPGTAAQFHGGYLFPARGWIGKPDKERVALVIDDQGDVSL
jgi:hypothetical protein